MEATPEFMDSCRISWGKVLHVSGPTIVVEYEPLVKKDNALSLGAPIEKKIVRRLEAEYDIEMLKVDEYVSIHWDVPCEVIDKETVQKLQQYTLEAINIANK